MTMNDNGNCNNGSSAWSSFENLSFWNGCDKVDAGTVAVSPRSTTVALLPQVEPLPLVPSFISSSVSCTTTAVSAATPAATANSYSAFPCIWPMGSLEPTPIGPNITIKNATIEPTAATMAVPPLPPATHTKRQVPSLKHKTIKKPKRSRNLYNYFYAHHRRLILQEQNAQGSKGNLQAMSREISRRWHCATQADKAMFQRMADCDKERHKRQLEAWKNEHIMAHLQQQQERQQQERAWEV